MKKSFFLLIGILIAICISASRSAAYDPFTQTGDLFYNENQVVYLTNLERRAVGRPPLRWNRELTAAARWFAWDTVENEWNDALFCDHSDTLGGGMGDRTSGQGWKGFTNAENAFCGYVSPEDAVYGWMHSDGHRDNILNDTSHEIGVGYYRNTNTNRAFEVQDFAVDGVFPPMIIENEKPFTTSPAVTLYQYSPANPGRILNFSRAVQMMQSEDPCFTNASWTPYQTETTFNLTPGTGWRTVYSKIKDIAGRTSTASDTIYLGSSIPVNEINQSMMSQTNPSVTLYGLNNGGYPNMQLSAGWVGDDTDESFWQWWGAQGTRVNDASAMGGTAYLFPPGDEAMVWIDTWDFIPDADMVAYFRLKTNSNTSTNEIARIQVEANGDTTRWLSIKGSDFPAANQYKEFALPFRYTLNPNDWSWLTFYIWRSGDATITFDTVTVFTANIPFNASYNTAYTWNVPGGHYRGQGVWVRYTDNQGGFTSLQEARTMPSMLQSNTNSIILLAKTGQPTTARSLTISQTCMAAQLQVISKPSWLSTSITGNTITYQATGQPVGYYTGDIVIASTGAAGNLTIPVTYRVANQLYPVYLPSTRK